MVERKPIGAVIEAAQAIKMPQVLRVTFTARADFSLTSNDDLQRLIDWREGMMRYGDIIKTEMKVVDANS